MPKIVNIRQDPFERTPVFEVGQRLKADFENGRHYYDMHGQLIAPPRADDLNRSRR